MSTWTVCSAGGEDGRVLVGVRKSATEEEEDEEEEGVFNSTGTSTRGISIPTWARFLGGSV